MEGRRAKRTINMILLALVVALSIIAASHITDWLVPAGADESQHCCDTPLMIASRQPVPQGLDWYHVVVFGDNRPQNTSGQKFNLVFYKIVDETRSINPYAVIGTGDHVGEGRRYQYEELWKTLNGLPNLLLTPGNHDLLISGSQERWENYVGSRYLHAELIPNWSIILVDSYTRNMKEFNSNVTSMFNQSIGPHRILVTHYSVKPDLDYNIDDTCCGGRKKQLLLSMISEYNVSLVLQGHWHGYAEKHDNRTLYIVTGGAGAPLYREPSNNDADYLRVMLYHYIILVLSPDGSYQVIPVYAPKGNITVSKPQSDTAIIYHDKYLITGKKAEIPVLVYLEKDNTKVGVSLFAPFGKQIEVRLVSVSPLEIQVNGSASKVEAFYVDNMAPVKLTGQSSADGSILLSGSLQEPAGGAISENKDNTSPTSEQAKVENTIRSILLGPETLLAFAVIIVIVVLKLKY